MDRQTWSTKSPAIYAEKLAAAVAVYLSRIAILESWGRIPAVFVAALPHGNQRLTRVSASRVTNCKSTTYKIYKGADSIGSNPKSF
jgi:hypothetical protein